MKKNEMRLTGKEKEQKQEKIINRILINFGVAILGYGLLWFLYTKTYMANGITFAIAGLFLIAAILCFLFRKKAKLINYGWMLLAFSAALVFTRLSTILFRILGSGIFMNMIRYRLFEILVNTRYEVMFIYILGIFYLAGMLIYNIRAYIKLSHHA